MKPLSRSGRRSVTTPTLALATFGFTALLALCSLAIPAAPTSPTNAPTVTAKLSQTTLVQGDTSTVYLDVAVKSPSVPGGETAQRASNVVVVLDNSGSMAEANKLTFAKAAIHDLLGRLGANDRFALVTFSDQAAVHSPLVNASDEKRRQLNGDVDKIEPAGGTNMGAGLNQALALLRQENQSNPTTVLLLSDGHANQGITDPAGLGRIVAAMTQRQAVVSTIGMGLDFNETLLSALADHGMGTYAYLENLAGLGGIFAGNLNATRSIFAASSSVSITLPSGIELTDAGGYPIEKQPNNSYRVTTGQLLGDSEKRFVMSLAVKTGQTGSLNLGPMQLAFQANGQDATLPVASAALALQVVPPDRRRDAMASINPDVYRETWSKNNYGKAQKEVSRWIREGKKDQADAVIEKYRQDVSKAEQESGLSLASPELADKIGTVQRSITDAFSGDRMEQQTKQKRAAKSLQSGSLKEQRSELNR